MDRIPHIIEVALFLLVAFLLGCIIGWAVQRVLARHAAGKTTPEPSAPSPESLSTPGAEPEKATPAKVLQASPSDPATPKNEAGRPRGLEAPRRDGADNLKKIKGIGPKLEKKLNELGIYHFDQIAAWDSAAVNWVDSYLSFKGRIARDGWVEQAKSLSRS